MYYKDYIEKFDESTLLSFDRLGAYFMDLKEVA